MNALMVKNHFSIKTGFGFLVTRRTSSLVPIVVPGLSNSSSGSDSSTSRTLPRLGSHCSTSSSSSSSSSTISEIKTREREDRIESDISPVKLCQLRLMSDQGDPIWTKPIKIQNQKKKGTQEGTGRPVVCRLRSCKL